MNLVRHHLDRLFILAFVIAFFSQPVYAEDSPTSSNEAIAWLKKIASAPRSHNYQGTFIYYADDHIETSKITHLVDEKGERERIEVLDGMSRIVFRDNDLMTCFLPESKKIYTEHRWFRKFFPDLLTQPLDDIDSNYHVTIEAPERVAGHYAQAILLTPRDSFRYAHKFWIHADTGVLLKVAVLEDDEIIEQFAFAQLEIGGKIDADLIKPDQDVDHADWQTTNLMTMILKEDELTWQIKNVPAGFKKIIEMRRDLTGRSDLVEHIALSDGLATVSIFIEPLNEHSSPLVPGFYSSRGAINIYVRSFEQHKITTIGEVPLETIQEIGDSIYSKDINVAVED